NVLMEPLNRRTFLRERSHMQNLSARPFLERLKPLAVEGHRILFPPHLFCGCTDHLCGHKVGLPDHHRPLPTALIARCERRHIVSPPQTLERHDGIVDTRLALLHHELDGVGIRSPVWPMRCTGASVPS